MNWPSAPAAAWDDLVARTAPYAHLHRQWEPADGPLPALFVSHGAPPTLDDPVWLDGLYRWARSLPKPRGIVVVSAHWESAPAALSATAAGAPLYYDFGGFHPRYYSLAYPTPDATDLGRRLASAVGLRQVHQFTHRGLDHGAFIPLMAMYPAGDVPVAQLSMPSLAPQELWRLGRALHDLRAEGILVIGSGFMTHSFAVFRDPLLAGALRGFDQWVVERLAAGDVDALTDYVAKAPAARIAHPTADHYVPLLVTLGASDDPASAISALQGEVFHNSIRSLQVR
jgi:4,5-DOPA dioxygenase extradiol